MPAVPDAHVIIRPATQADAAALHALAAATFPLACPPGTAEASMAAFIAEHLSVERFSAYLADPDRLILVAADAEGLAGYTMLVDGDPSDEAVAGALTTRPTTELSKVYALPRVQGSGLAAALVEATVEAAAARGAAAVWLGVNQHNPRANAFYDKLGFAVVGTKTFTVGDERHDDFSRERVLAR